MEKTKKTINKTTNDPISDFLTRIRNAMLIKSDNVRIPYSTLKKNLAELLKQEGYINGHSVINEEDPAMKSIQVELKYTMDGVSVIAGLRRISKPGLRKYTKSKKAPRVFNGLGISVVSTSKGLMTDRKARKENIGGEILCQVW